MRWANTLPRGPAAGRGDRAARGRRPTALLVLHLHANRSAWRPARPTADAGAAHRYSSSEGMHKLGPSVDASKSKIENFRQSGLSRERDPRSVVGSLLRVKVNQDLGRRGTRIFHGFFFHGATPASPAADPSREVARRIGIHLNRDSTYSPARPVLRHRKEGAGSLPAPLGRQTRRQVRPVTARARSRSAMARRELRADHLLRFSVRGQSAHEPRKSCHARWGVSPQLDRRCRDGDAGIGEPTVSPRSSRAWLASCVPTSPR